MTSVEDILNAKRSLRARAQEAYQRRKEDDEQAAEEERDELEDAAVQFMRAVLGMNDAEIYDTEIQRGHYRAKRQQVLFMVDNIRFRVRYESKPLMKARSSQFVTEETIYESVLVYEAQGKAADNFKTVSCLADIGALL